MIITLGGKYGCGGKRIGETAAKLLGYRLCDDDAVQTAIADSSVDMTEETFKYFDESLGAAALEEMRKLSRLQAKSYDGLVSSLTLDVLPLDRRLEENMKNVFDKFAQGGDCIILGRCADYYLGERKDIIRVFVTDDEDACVARIMEHFGIGEEQAKRAIRKANKRRDDYYGFFTGKRWGDMSNYDLILKCSILGVDGCAELIKDAVAIKAKAATK